jgi:hypothetical protein
MQEAIARGAEEDPYFDEEARKDGKEAGKAIRWQFMLFLH